MWPIGVRRGWAEAFGKATGDDAAEHSPQAETEVVDWSAAAAKVAERWRATRSVPVSVSGSMSGSMSVPMSMSVSSRSTWSRHRFFAPPKELASTCVGAHGFPTSNGWRYKQHRYREV